MYKINFQLEGSQSAYYQVDWNTQTVFPLNCGYNFRKVHVYHNILFKVFDLGVAQRALKILYSFLKMSS